MKKNNLTYSGTGVNYTGMDPIKRLAQLKALKTTNNLIGSGFKEVSASRGESAYVLETKNNFTAFVIEGLGTKNLVADEMMKITGKSYYQEIAQDTVAMIVNDIITVGAKPIVINAYWAVGSSSWFENKKRANDLVTGWANACDMAGAVWGGGETPTLKGVIEKDTIDLGGSCIGIIDPKDRYISGDKLTEGDIIILLESSGIHANGLTMARKIADGLPHGYKTIMNNKKTYGEALLAPTIIYAKLIDVLLKKNISIHYLSNITGHGWRKLMRNNRSFTYRIHSLPPVPEVLRFMMEKGPIDEKEAYGNFNMGAGFAIYISKKDVMKVLEMAKEHKIKAYPYGVVEKGKKQVIIEPKKIIFSENSLQIR